ncbi:MULTISPECIES: TetR/AcrR family transcriptional regulator [Pseudomonas]|jgi:AcrR family transcriptional regulator|uniref:TetR family transcriptional regulator n=1 Tax=Pseudomonas monteilii SB3101 TaxID=1435058 RepID=V9V2Y1_9PSED|nr:MULTISPECIES: TetR/AcrR family transcriptional regulator [Pseudomonas]AHC83297.1 TetR family transcriptional regulator [Pseudomonas monteilii SB3078]AHC88673.1 TetR family transcriptional regulator [Pseudomonas monteilii SB3101]AHZ78005.1 transcriptional regulator TetR [Pseudomonas putida]KAF4561666.1 TetR/AcrR family transcriptional regulator [Pseudomonas sp. CES]KGK26302.1 TetR family transcriptional regulator [Pseudomonas plecoglossicida]
MPPVNAAMRCANFEERRDRAMALFAEKGFGQVSMRELAAHVGLTAGSLYHHFPSKQDLLYDLIEELYEELQATLDQGRRAMARGASALSCLIAAHWQLHAERPMQFRLAERDFCCLSDDQQARLALLRKRYEAGLLRLIAPQAKLQGQALVATAHVVATLLNQLPGLLKALPEEQGLGLMESMLVGGLERTLR